MNCVGVSPGPRRRSRGQSKFWLWGVSFLPNNVSAEISDNLFSAEIALLRSERGLHSVGFLAQINIFRYVSAKVSLFRLNRPFQSNFCFENCPVLVLCASEKNLFRSHTSFAHEEEARQIAQLSSGLGIIPLRRAIIPLLNYSRCEECGGTKPRHRSSRRDDRERSRAKMSSLPPVQYPSYGSGTSELHIVTLLTSDY